MIRLNRLLTSIAMAGALGAAEPADPPGTTAGRETPARFTFFAMDTAVGGGSPAEVAARVAKLGYDGLGWTPNQVPAMRDACRRENIRLVAVYAGLTLENAALDGLYRTIDELKESEAILWLPVGSSKYERSSPAGDETAVAQLRSLADRAQAAGVKIALYPHTGMWLERVEDAVRLAKKVDRPNVGATFNLCHFLRVDKPENLPSAVRTAMPHLFVVTINGADTDGKDWNTLIQTLDRGSFDTVPLVRLLIDQGYHGPIGFQGYGIAGDPAENLARTHKAWLRILAQAQTAQ